MTTTTSVQTPAWLTPPERRRSKLAQLWQVPVFLAGVAALLVVTVGGAARHSEQREQFFRHLDELQRVLQAPGGDLRHAVAVGQELVGHSARFTGKAGEAHMLLGVALQRLADRAAADEAKSLRGQSLAHLQQAEAAGVALADRPKLWYHIGKALFHSGGDLRQAIGYLSRSLPKGAETPGEGYGLLVAAYLRLPEPDLDAALLANEQQLRLTTDDRSLNQARLLRGELLVRRRLYDQALRVLERIGPAAAPAVWQRALYLQAHAGEQLGMWEAAIPLWEELLKTPDQVPGGRRKILYTLGLSYCNATPADEKRAVWAWGEALKLGGDEARAAAVQLADLYLRPPLQDFDKAVEYLKGGLEGVGSADEFPGGLVSAEDVRGVLTAGLEAARGKGAYGQAQQLALLYQRLAGPGQGDPPLARVTEAWAEDLAARAGRAPRPEADDLAGQAQAQFRQAAEYYLRAARGAQDAARRADLLWRAARDYRKGEDHAAAVPVLEEYVALEVPPERKAEAWFALAKARAALGHSGDAAAAYDTCTKYPDSPCAYQARYHLALEKIRAERFDEAEAILWENLRNARTAQLAREAHEKSLYKLAVLLYQRRDFDRAYLELKEASRQYPDNPDVMMVRDLLGDTYRQLAEKEREYTVNRVDARAPKVQNDARRKRLQWLELAGQTYQQLADDLDQRKARQGLSELEEKLRRKASFAATDVLFDTDLYREALRRYKLLAAEYRGQVEELIACQRVWRCCPVLWPRLWGVSDRPDLPALHDPEELRATLVAVKEVLASAEANLPKLPDEHFQGPGTWSRRQWQDWIGQVRAEADRKLVEVGRLVPEHEAIRRGPQAGPGDGGP